MINCRCTKTIGFSNERQIWELVIHSAYIFTEEPSMLSVSGRVFVHQVTGVGQIQDPERQRDSGVVCIVLGEYQELTQQVAQEVLVSLERLFLHQLEELLLQGGSEMGSLKGQVKVHPGGVVSEKKKRNTKWALLYINLNYCGIVLNHRGQCLWIIKTGSRGHNYVCSQFRSLHIWL